MNICWIGISNQKNGIGEAVAPFCNKTPTGKFLDNLISTLPENCQHNKRNYVERVLIDEKGKLRNPTKCELENSWSYFSEFIQGESNTTFVFFSGLLRQFISKKMYGHVMPKYKIQSHENNWITFFDHPSYINVYKHKYREDYIEKMANLVSSHRA